MTQTILVTGGLGYIGSHTVVELIKCGYEVLILDNLSNSSELVINGIQKITEKIPKLYLGDIRDHKILQTIFDNNDIHSVIHFAGLKSISESEEKPLLYFDNNVSGSISLFHEMIRAGVNRIIFSSSATVYAPSNNYKFTENMFLSPTNVYGKTKLKVEEILCKLKKENPLLGIVIFRYFNPVGAHCSSFLGESPKGISSNLMPYISDVAKGFREKLFIFGGDYATPDGTGLRDYIHIKDLAAAHIAALKKLDTEQDLIIVNLGTGIPYSVLNVIDAFERVSGKKIPYEIVDRRKGDVAGCYADPTLAEKLLHWKSKLGLDDMCLSQWNFIKKNN